MRHTFFALFSDLEAAERAIEELLASDLVRQEHVSVVVRRDVDPERFEDLVLTEGAVAETDGGPNAVRGAIVGGIAGAVILGPIGLVGMGPAASVLLGALLGTVPGAFVGGLTGFGFPDHALRRLMKRLHAGDTLLTLDADSRARVREVEALLERHGAVLGEKQLV